MTRVATTYVEETAFGFCFLQSHVWQQHALRVALGEFWRVLKPGGQRDETLVNLVARKPLQRLQP